MRINNVFSGRPAYYDRNPVAISKAYLATGLAPAVTVTRWTYVVPSNRKFNCGGMSVLVVRDTVATTAGIVAAYGVYTPNLGSPISTLYVETISNVVDAGRLLAGLGGFTMLAGDSLAGITTDNSTAGTMDFSNAMTGTEFDA